MAPPSQAATATTGKRKKQHKPAKNLAVKSTNPVSKKARKQKMPRPPAEQDETNTAAAAAAVGEPAGGGVLLSAALPPARQLEFLLRSFERATKMRLSPLELGAYSGMYTCTRTTVSASVKFKSVCFYARLAVSVRWIIKVFLDPLVLSVEECMVQLAEGASQDVESLADHVKGAFGAMWKGELCEGKLVEGSVDVGSPALLVISLGALRSLELLRYLLLSSLFLVKLLL